MTQDEILATADACGMMLFGLGLDKAKFEFCILAFAKQIAKLERHYEREALAQPEQEPVAWKLPDKNVVFWEDTKEVDEYHGFKPTIPLYPHPQRTWVGLTLDEIALLHANYPNPQGFALALQAKLKERNT